MKGFKSKPLSIIKKGILFFVLIIIRCATVNSIPLRWITRLPLLFMVWILKDNAYSLISSALNTMHSKPAKETRFSKMSLRLFITRALIGDKTASVECYCRLLSQTQPPTKVKLDVLHRFMGAGRLDLAKATVDDLIGSKPDDFFTSHRLAIYRQAGTIYFMLGKNREANHFWRLAGRARKSLFKPGTPTKYRILGSSWFAAVGHVAMLDYYLKYKRLMGQEDHRIVATPFANFGCTPELMQKFSKQGIVLLGENELANDYDDWAKDNAAPRWQDLSSQEREALIDDFWEHEFPDGEILSYTHAAARIQKEWDLAGHPPLQTVTHAEKLWLGEFLAKLGLPPNAWFACLHVREAGFHQQWNAKLPAMRDSEITDYLPAIQEIIDAGGWVLRMGDASMKKLPPMRNVIDYAHCPLKEPLADMLIAASCRFFLGTNSGFATIPAIYGIPCALTNWIPIGWPLWQNIDLMICKLFREKATQRFLTLEEIFEQGLAFLQNWCDLPKEIELVANTPEEIRQLVLEMLSSFDHNKYSLATSGALSELQNRYTKIAHRFETFTSSRFAETFVKKHSEVFASKPASEAKMDEEHRANASPKMHETIGI